MSIRNNFINEALETVLETLSSMRVFAKKAVEIFCNEQDLENGQILLRDLLAKRPVFFASRGTPGDYTAGLEYSKEYLEKLDDTIKTFKEFLSQVKAGDSLADDKDSVI